MLIIDTDAGVDDAVAIMMAITSSKEKIVAITCVNGNVSLDKVLVNVSRIIHYCDVKIPIYRGCDSPLFSIEHKNASEWHGNDGLGDIEYNEEIDIKVEKEIAANALIRLVNEHPNEISILALGPLTNIALAIKLQPSFLSKVKNLTCMGGCSRGNASLGAEFNVFVDPEAYAIALQSCEKYNKVLTLVSWELTLDSGLDFKWIDSEWYHFTECDNKKKIFQRAINNLLIKKSRGNSSFVNFGYLIPDQIASAVMIDESVIIESELRFAVCELNGHFTRGMIMFDTDHLFFSTKNKNVRYIKSINMEKLKELLIKSVQ